MSARFLLAATTAALLAAPLSAFAQAAPAATPAPVAAPAATSPAPATPAPALAASPNLTAKGDMVATLQGSTHFTVLTKALDASNLSGVLKSVPNLTLFAPTDEAFANLPSAQLAALMDAKNANLLQKILTYHLVHLDLDSSKIKGAKGPVTSVETASLQLDGSGDPLKVNDANIIQADVRATNGVIHVVDKVLIPAGVTIPVAAAAAAGAAGPATGG